MTAVQQDRQTDTSDLDLTVHTLTILMIRGREGGRGSFGCLNVFLGLFGGDYLIIFFQGQVLLSICIRR